MSRILNEHLVYVSDAVRMRALGEAIAERVKPGDVVLDLGAGTGIISLLACRAGARRVYCIDAGGIIGLAREIVRANGVEDRVVCLRGLSTRVELPERVDVVIAELVGRFGFDARLIEFLADARERFLKPGGAIIPASLELWVAPVDARELWHQVEFWAGSPHGFDFAPARRIAVNASHAATLAAAHLLGAPARAAAVDLRAATPDRLKLDATIRIDRAGTLHGIGGGFTAALTERVTMTNSPLAPDSVDRRRAFFPVDRPVPVVPGDEVRIVMRIIPSEIVVAWLVEVRDAGGGEKGRFSHSTLRGMLVSKEDLARTRPDFTPRLTRWGRAQRSVLELCDGGPPLEDVEQEVYRRHRAQFRSLGEAQKFVAEVVTKYCE